ncbi:MAG: c-type cytochrome [Sphingomonadales bacterium]|jgi:mono/diheme cytochrome c family protein
MRTLVMAAALSLSFSLKAQFKASAEEGKKLYEANNCGSCHALDKKVVGPALRGVTERRSEEWLIKWIRNNEAFRKSGDADANALYKEYGGAAMNIFENLSPDQVKHILEYIKTAPKPTAAKTSAAVAGDEGSKSDSNTQYVLLALIGIFVIVLIILGKVRNTLRRLAAEQDGTAEDENKGSFLKGLLPEKLAKMNPTVLIVFTVVILGGIGFVSSYKFGITEIGVQKGYAPKQPIAYSHKLHAGDLKIDCKYCHIGVEESKSATIPSLNICMNCHKGVQKASTAEGDEISPEIAKIYKALDYNPEKIGAEAFGNNPKPIRWVRIHNLPDHAYFNHSQHVKVAGLACQTCHGPIEKMEVVQQWSSLQMGWCIDCHRNAGIDAANNNYYAALHEKAAKDLKDNKNKSQYFGPDGKVRITPAMNGGLECAKCHY